MLVNSDRLQFIRKPKIFFGLKNFQKYFIKVVLHD